MFLDQRDHLNSYSSTVCDNRIREIIVFINNLTKTACISHVLGQLALLYQRKAQLQATEHIDQLFQMQKNYEMMQQTTKHLLA